MSTAPTTTVPPAAATATRGKTPPGVKWSNAWKNPQGVITPCPEPGVEVPINDAWEMVGHLWVCPVVGCAVASWTFDPIASVLDDAPCCSKHPARLVPAPWSATDADPVRSARDRVAAHVRGVYEARKQAAVHAAQARAMAAQQVVAEATRRTTADMREHAPSIAVSGIVIGAGSALVLSDAPIAAAVGMGMTTFGAVVAYLVAYVVRRLKTRARKDAKQARKDRAFARHVAAGTLTTGVWLILSSAAGILPLTMQALFTLLLGFLLAFAVNHQHWAELWEARHRLKEMARRKAEAEAARAAEEAERLAVQPAPAGAAVNDDDTDPKVVGAKMAARWRAIAHTDLVPSTFPMRRSWIVVEEVRQVTALRDGEPVHVGWEFMIQAEPGAFVARPGMPPPLTSARDWLASMLEVDPATLSLTDRPDGQINRGLMMLTDGIPLGDAVAWKGPAGIRKGSDGSLYGHAGRTIFGDDVEQSLWIPGQAGGSGRYGVTGSGKTAATQVTLLNDLAAGIFSILHDGKNLMDFAEFIGVIPVGCTVEHRDVIRRSLWAEMNRRQRMLTLMEAKDRHGRNAPVEALWRIERDGPPIRCTWEEFHLQRKDQQFIADLSELVRLQRSTAIMQETSTQGGGLADMGDSVLRDQLNQIRMQIMRMSDSSARLTGYNGAEMPSKLPRLPGMMLLIDAEAPPVPMRSAYVHRRDEDGSIYDQLFAPDGSPLLTAPSLPAETVEVFEREGLMDLWRLGQGPGGRARLLSNDVAQAGTAAVPTGVVKAELPAADVVLAIVHTSPGCARALIDAHPVWLTAGGGGKAPVPSTVSRAAKKLDDDGLVTRTKDGADYRVTAKGATRAVKAATVLHLLAEADEPTAESEARDMRAAEASA